MSFELTDLLLAVGAATTMGGAIWLHRSSGKNTTYHPAGSGSPQRSTQTGNTAPPPPGFIPVMAAGQLVEQIGAQCFHTEIYQALGFAPENYDVDVQPLLDTVANFVQLLPASESHHHANPGGLLFHLLEVASLALRFSEEAKLPIGRATEDQLKFAARWRYGVLLAALLHDIGKPLSDVVVEIRDSRGGLQIWNGFGGLIGDFGSFYRVTFPLSRDYKAHQRLPVMLLKSVVPGSTMKWLSDDPELIPLLISYLSGESNGGAIGKLVLRADQESVRRNLANADRTRFATARQIPLVERLALGLQRMLAEGGHLPLNREGAAGFFDGQHIWFVAGVVADKVRDYLDKSEIRESGAAALPTDNSRLFDIWLDYGFIQSNNGSAIWKRLITIVRPDGSTWVQAFTMLSFPVEKLFPNPNDYPAILPGRIEEIPGTANIAIEATPATDTSPPPPSAPAVPSPQAEAPILELTPSPLFPSHASVETDEWAPAFSTETPNIVNVPAVSLEAPSSTATDEFLDEQDMAIAVPNPVASARSPASSAPVAPIVPAQVRPPKNSAVGDVAPDPEIEQFIAWIQLGIGNGQLKFNRADATVHFVKEGVLLITPKIFRDYLEAIDEPDNEAGSKVKRLQRLLQRSGYVAKSNSKSFLHFYRITTAKNASRSQITGYLLPKPAQFFNPVPPANPALISSSSEGDDDLPH